MRDGLETPVSRPRWAARRQLEPETSHPPLTPAPTLRLVEKWTGLRKAWFAAFALACVGLMSIGAIGVFQGDDTRVIRVLILAVSAIAWITSAVIARTIKRSQTEEPSERA